MKKISFLLLTILMLFTLSACGSKEENTGPSASEQLETLKEEHEANMQQIDNEHPISAAVSEVPLVGGVVGFFSGYNEAKATETDTYNKQVTAVSTETAAKNGFNPKIIIIGVIVVLILIILAILILKARPKNADVKTPLQVQTPTPPPTEGANARFDDY